MKNKRYKRFVRNSTIPRLQNVFILIHSFGSRGTSKMLFKNLKKQINSFINEKTYRLVLVFFELG